ncbi:hypothetical protein [Nostoc commune]|uniref:hypothetical protein n=1 Tax=Nostoc commune TaxID=1178 RepID=UPI0018C7D3CD|nr:hypothetical protein [Nostoc commune]MBG1259892.1 hypothetical protein [Nostoc commune BAE]
MYNEYDNLSFEEQLHLTEEEMRRRHDQQMFLRRNAQLLQQELSFEAGLLEENPELAQVIHSLNMQEIQSNQRGLQNVLGSEESPSK